MSSFNASGGGGGGGGTSVNIPQISTSISDWNGNSTKKNDAGVSAQRGVDELNAPGAAESIGGVPDYAFLMDSIKQLGNQTVSLPVDLQVSINNAAQAQLGANQMQRAVKGGDVSAAAQTLGSDAMANAALNPSAKGFAKSVDQNVGAEQDLEKKEAKMSGDEAVKNTSNVDLSNLRNLIMQGQAHHANATFRNQTAAMAEDLTNTNNKGIEQVRNAGEDAKAALLRAQTTGDVAAWGNTMTAIRGATAGGGAAASAIASANGGKGGVSYEGDDPGTDYNSSGASWAQGGAPNAEPDNYEGE